MPDQLMYFVVGDRNLNAGNGIFVQTLEALRNRLLSVTHRHPWTLVISIHGSQNILATQGGYLRNPNGPGVYDAAVIQRVFNRHDRFPTWRRRHGPTRVVLNACQVALPLERTILSALLRSGSAQRAHGLGAGCRPGTTTMTLEYNNASITTRRQWLAIPRRDRLPLLRRLEHLNREFGYFGAPPVPGNQILNYYFDEEPLGGWVAYRSSDSLEEKY